MLTLDHHGYAQTIAVGTADELWERALHLTVRGEPVAPRGQVCYERRGVTLILMNANRNVVTCPQRKLNYAFSVAEWVWIRGGHSSVKLIAPFNKQISQFSDDGQTFFGAYGPRVAPAMPAIEALLRRDPDTRQAVVSIWRPEALGTPTKDVPCTLTWQFFIRDGALDMHVSMRSNDVWLGLPYDLFTFTQIQRELARNLNVPTGRYVHHVGSLHIYEQHVAQAQAILDLAVPVRRHQSVIVPAVHSITGLDLVLERCAAYDQFQGVGNLERLTNFCQTTINEQPELAEYVGVLHQKVTKTTNLLGPVYRSLMGLA